MKSFLYLTPRRPWTTPILDVTTRKMAAAFRAATLHASWRGSHRCPCGALTSTDHALPDKKRITNGLAVHYIACHRADVSPGELAVVNAYTAEVEPTEDELHYYRVHLVCSHCGAEEERYTTSRRSGLHDQCKACFDSMCLALDAGHDALLRWFEEHPHRKAVAR